MRIAIAGIGGRVGSLLAALVPERGHTLAGGIGRHADNAALLSLAHTADVVIDFSHAAATARNAPTLAAARTPWVLGTTGLDDAAQTAVHDAARLIPVVQAANFSPGVVLVTELAARLAAALPEGDYDAEILEMHHRGKRDAPSGTARAIGAAVAAARHRTLPEAAIYARAGETGPRPPGAIGFATLRGGAIVGEHAVSFTSGSERITLAHEAFDRTAFAEGALRAAAWVRNRPPGLYGMRDVLGLASSGQPTS